MLTQTQVRRYSAQSGLRDMMIAEKEVVLTFLLQLLSERGILDRLAFKGGTCLRKMFIGSQGRFSTDLDFTGLGEHDHEDVIVSRRVPHNNLRDCGHICTSVASSRKRHRALASCICRGLLHSGSNNLGLILRVKAIPKRHPTNSPSAWVSMP